MEIMGKFREMFHVSRADEFPSIHDKISFTPLPDKAAVLRYLRSGTEVFSMLSSSYEIVQGTKRLLGGDSVITDGRHLWRDDLEFYFDTYNVELPTHFLEFIRQNSYTVPELEEDLLVELAQRASELISPSAPGPENAPALGSPAQDPGLTLSTSSFPERMAPEDAEDKMRQTASGKEPLPAGWVPERIPASHWWRAAERTGPGDPLPTGTDLAAGSSANSDRPLPLPFLQVLSRGTLTPTEASELIAHLGLKPVARTIGPGSSGSIAHRSFAASDDSTVTVDLGRVGSDGWVMTLLYEGTVPDPRIASGYRARFRQLIEHCGLNLIEIDPPMQADEVHMVEPATPEAAPIGLSWELPYHRLADMWMHIGLTDDAPDEVKKVKLREVTRTPIWQVAPQPLRDEVDAFLTEN